MLCEGCYNRAASRHVAGLVMLTTLDLLQMNRVSRDLDRWQVCNTFTIAWYDSSHISAFVSPVMPENCPGSTRKGDYHETTGYQAVRYGKMSVPCLAGV